MATSNITNTVKDANGNAIVGAKVVIRLMPCAGFKITDGTELAQRYDTVTDANGAWTAALEQTANITPSGTYYEVEEKIPAANGNGKKWIIQVGAAGATLQASLVTAIPAITTSTYLTQAAADARYVQSPGSFATVGTITDSRPDDTATAGVLTTYTRGDHRHDRETTYGTAAIRAALAGNDLYEGEVFRETDTRKSFVYRAAAWLQVRDTIIVADATARTAITTPYEGMDVYQLDTDITYTYTGAIWVITNTHGAWIAYSPTVKLGATVVSVATDCAYWRAGRSIQARGGFRYTNLNGGSGTLTVTRPVAGQYTAATPNLGNAYTQPIGAADFIDVSAGSLFMGQCTPDLSDGTNFVIRSTAIPVAVYTQAVPVTVAAGALATGDEQYFYLAYESAA